MATFLVVRVNAIEMPPAPGPSSFPKKLIDAIRKSGAKGVISAFKGDPKFHASELQLSYYTNSRGKLTGEFLIGNFTDIDRSYTLAILVDYMQKKFSTGGKSALYHKMNVESGQNVITSITIDNIADGGHDVIVLAIDSKHKNDMIGANFPVLYHRANFYVKHNDMPVVSYKKNKEERGVARVPRVVVNMSDKVADFKEVYSGTGVVSKKNYFVHINNESETTSRYAALAIRPSSSSPIIPIDKSIPSFFEVSAQKSAMLPFASELLKAGDQIYIILFREPFVRLEKKYGKINEVHSELLISKRVTAN